MLGRPRTKQEETIGVAPQPSPLVPPAEPQPMAGSDRGGYGRCSLSQETGTQNNDFYEIEVMTIKLSAISLATFGLLSAGCHDHVAIGAVTLPADLEGDYVVTAQITSADCDPEVVGQILELAARIEAAGEDLRLTLEKVGALLGTAGANDITFEGSVTLPGEGGECTFSLPMSATGEDPLALFGTLTIFCGEECIFTVSISATRVEGEPSALLLAEDSWVAYTVTLPDGEGQLGLWRSDLDDTGRPTAEYSEAVENLSGGAHILHDGRHR